MKNKLYLRVKKILLNKKIVSFLVCVLIATFLWLVNALNRTYTKTIDIPVKFINFPKNKVLSSELPKMIHAEIKTTGAKLFFIEFNKNKTEIEIDLGKLNIDQTNLKNLAINTGISIGNLSRLFNAEIELLKVKPDSIYFTFGKSYQKIIPIIPDVQVDFDTLYNYGDKIKVMPSSVILYGDSSLLSKLDDIKTEKIVLNNLNKNITQKASLILPEDFQQRVGLSCNEVQLNINVDKFTQLNLDVPIEVINTPDNIELIVFPNKCVLQIKVGLLEYDSLKADQFNVIADYKDIVKYKNKLPLKVAQQPDNVKVIKIQPEKVDYLIKKY